MRDRMRLVLLAQRRLRTGRHVSVMRRDFFPEAALLYACDRVGRGEHVPEWAANVLGPRRDSRAAAIPRSPSQDARDERRQAPRIERIERAARAPLGDLSSFGDTSIGDAFAASEPSAPALRVSSRPRAIGHVVRGEVSSARRDASDPSNAPPSSDGANGDSASSDDARRKPRRRRR